MDFGLDRSTTPTCVFLCFARSQVWDVPMGGNNDKTLVSCVKFPSDVNREFHGRSPFKTTLESSDAFAYCLDLQKLKQMLEIIGGQVHHVSAYHDPTCARLVFERLVWAMPMDIQTPVFQNTVLQSTFMPM